MNLNSVSDLRQLLCLLVHRRYGGSAITETRQPALNLNSGSVLRIIVSDHASRHMKEFKLHFNQFAILDVTATELTTILHPNCGLFTSEQALIWKPVFFSQTEINTY